MSLFILATVTIISFLWIKCEGSSSIFNEGEWQSQHGMHCQERLDKNEDLVEARSSECPVHQEGDINKIGTTCGNIHLCFRDDPPQSALAQKFRKFNCGQKVDKYYQATIDSSAVDDTFDNDFLSLLQASTFTPGGSGTIQHYGVYNEGKSGKFPIPDYLTKVGDHGPQWPDYTPPEIKQGNDGSSQKYPMWNTDGQYTIDTMPKPDLLLQGSEENPISPDVYQVPGAAVGGSHTICAAFDYYACNDAFCDAEGSGDTWFLNYGATTKAMAWTSWGAYKWKVGPAERGGHLPYVHNALWGLHGDRKTFRKQLVCTVYDSFNKWLSMYVNGILFAEKPLNQYCYTMQSTWYVSNQYGDVIDVSKNDLHVGMYPRDLGKNAGRDFGGRFYFIGVWNNFNMDQRQACLMAGINQDACVNLNIQNTSSGDSSNSLSLFFLASLLLVLCRWMLCTA